MAYEIPQQLQHKEKIIFGLTFVQLLWATFFIFILLFIFKMNISFTVRFMLALPPAMIGILFVFFDFGQWMFYLKSFLRFRSAKLNSTTMNKLIDIKKIEKDTMYSSTEIAILQINSLNFSIKTKDEKSTIIFGFQKFLNSLDFPVQLLVTTSNLSINSYLANLGKRTVNKNLFSDFSEFVKSMIVKNEMRNRSFYLVIPKKTDLDIQCNVCKQRLQSVGLKVSRLNDKQILNNLHLFFNDLGDERMDEEIVQNGLMYLIAPNLVKDNVDSFVQNKKYCRIISAIGYPRSVESGFLDKIISSNDDFDISIHIEPYSIDSMMVMLNKEIIKQRADLFAEKKRNGINPSLEIKHKDTLKVLENLQKGDEKLFNVSLYINCKAKSKQELNLLTKKVEAELNSLMIIPSVPLFRQIQGYKSVMPLAKDELKIKRNITTHALSAFFPFTSPFLNVENNGVMLGLNKNKVPFIKDIFSLSNANGIVLATSGSGKSYFTKLLISRQLMNKTQVLIVDPQSEYTNLIGHCKGELVTISRNSDTIINPLDLMGHDYIEKRLALMDMFKIMFGELTEIQKSILDKAIAETYERKGITSKSFKNKKPPILSDLYKVLERMDKKASTMEKVTYRALLNRLYLYSHGVFSFMNKQTSINFKRDLVCFNIGDMPKQVKPLVMFLILDYVYMKMKESKERKLLVIDEAWSLLSKAEEASYIFEIVKTCRKFNMGLLLITQDVSDLVNSKAGHAVLANSSYSLLLRQKPAIIDSVVKTFHLSELEKEYLLTATQGKGILIMDNDHQELSVVSSPKEHKLITTNADEILSAKPKEQELIDVTINLDLSNGLFYGSKLDIEQKNFLKNNDYDVGYFVPIGKPRQEECWVKTNNVEPIAHTFLVQNIKQELQKIAKKIEVHIVEKPDLLFWIKDKEYAIEVETGTSFKKRKSKIMNKFHEVKINYPNSMIVLTNPEYRRQYKSICPDMPLFVRSELPDLFKNIKRYPSKVLKSGMVKA